MLLAFNTFPHSVSYYLFVFCITIYFMLSCIDSNVHGKQPHIQNRFSNLIRDTIVEQHNHFRSLSIDQKRFANHDNNEVNILLQDSKLAIQNFEQHAVQRVEQEFEQIHKISSTRDTSFNELEYSIPLEHVAQSWAERCEQKNKIVAPSDKDLVKYAWVLYQKPEDIQFGLNSVQSTVEDKSKIPSNHQESLPSSIMKRYFNSKSDLKMNLPDFQLFNHSLAVASIYAPTHIIGAAATELISRIETGNISEENVASPSLVLINQVWTESSEVGCSEYRIFPNEVSKSPKGIVCVYSDSQQVTGSSHGQSMQDRSTQRNSHQSNTLQDNSTSNILEKCIVCEYKNEKGIEMKVNTKACEDSKLSLQNECSSINPSQKDCLLPIELCNVKRIYVTKESNSKGGKQPNYFSIGEESEHDTSAEKYITSDDTVLSKNFLFSLLLIFLLILMA